MVENKKENFLHFRNSNPIVQGYEVLYQEKQRFEQKLRGRWVFAEIKGPFVEN